MKLGGNKDIPVKAEEDGDCGPIIPSFVKGSRVDPVKEDGTLDGFGSAIEAVLADEKENRELEREPVPVEAKQEPVAPALAAEEEPVVVSVPAKDQSGDDIITMPNVGVSPTVLGERANLDDYKALPADVIELRNPLKNAVFIQLRVFLSETHVFKRPIDDEERQALDLIRGRLESLRDDCSKHGAEDWIEIIDSHLRTLGSILGKKSSLPGEQTIVPEELKISVPAVDSNLKPSEQYPTDVRESTWRRILKALKII